MRRISRVKIREGEYMAITFFEAASFYEYNRIKDRADTTFPLQLAVFHVDDYSVGFCTCAKSGKIQIVHTEKLPGNSTCIEDINQALREKLGEDVDICHCMDTSESRDAFNKAMRVYYRSNKSENASLKNILGFELDCAGADEAFGNAVNKWENLIAPLKDMWQKIEFDENESKFILAGKAALLYPIEHYIKSHLGYRPFLSSIEEYFVSDTYSDAKDRIVPIGESLYGEHLEREREREIFVTYISADGTGKERQAISPKEAGQEIEYWGPVFVASEEKLEFESSSQPFSVALPYPLDSSDGDLVEIGAYMRDDERMIRIRRCNDPAQIHDILIPEIG